MVGSVGAAQDDIVVSSITRDGVAATYQSTFSRPASASYPTANQPMFLTMKSFVGSQQRSYSYAFKPAFEWGRGRPAILYVDDALSRRTNFGFNSQMELSGFTKPEFDGVNNNYDSRQNVIQSVVRAKNGSGLPDAITMFAYPSQCTSAIQFTCNKPLSVTDPRGNVTDYQYNDRGQITVETRPAPTQGAPRPTVTNTFTLRNAFIKDSAGNPVPAGPPISLLTRSSTCRTQAVCSGTGDEVVTDYDYGPITGFNNLLLRGFAVTAANDQGQMQTLRTCYRYNYFGEKIAETEPNANLSVCP